MVAYVEVIVRILVASIFYYLPNSLVEFAHTTAPTHSSFAHVRPGWLAVCSTLPELWQNPLRFGSLCRANSLLPKGCANGMTEMKSAVQDKKRPESPMI